MGKRTKGVEAAAGGAQYVLAGTVIAGISSFVVLMVVAGSVGAERNAVFSVMWSTLFLVVAVLFGVQQETTRDTARRATTSGGNRALRSSLPVLGLIIAAITIVVLLSSSFAWSKTAFGAGNEILIWPVIVGCASYALVATFNGIYAGASLWKEFALIPAIDGVLRLLLIVAILPFSNDYVLLAWAVAIPFPASIAIVLSLSWKKISPFVRSDLSYAKLALNSMKTVGASVGAAVLINGFPLILKLTVGEADAALLGAFFMALMLTRAPILVPLMALQSLLVTKLSAIHGSLRPLLSKLFVGLGVIVLVLVAGAWLVGPQAFKLFLGSEFVLPHSVLLPLVASSGFLGALTISGSAVLSRDQHTNYAAGWITAAVVAILILVLPLGGVEARAISALCAGPFVGTLIHLFSLSRGPNLIGLRK